MMRVERHLSCSFLPHAKRSIDMRTLLQPFFFPFSFSFSSFTSNFFIVLAKWVCDRSSSPRCNHRNERWPIAEELKTQPFCRSIYISSCQEPTLGWDEILIVAHESSAMTVDSDLYRWETHSNTFLSSYYRTQIVCMAVYQTASHWRTMYHAYTTFRKDLGGGRDVRSVICFVRWSDRCQLLRPIQLNERNRSYY